VFLSYTYSAMLYFTLLYFTYLCYLVNGFIYIYRGVGIKMGEGVVWEEG
jgi:hypothetical protein